MNSRRSMFAPGSADSIVTAPAHNLIGAENRLQSKYLLGVSDVRAGSFATEFINDKSGHVRYAAESGSKNTPHFNTFCNNDQTIL